MLEITLCRTQTTRVSAISEHTPKYSLAPPLREPAERARLELYSYMYKQQTRTRVEEDGKPSPMCMFPAKRCDSRR